MTVGLFERRLTYEDLYNTSIMALSGYIDTYEVQRLAKIRRCWDFYEGFHWQEVESADKVQITENYCRPFINKYVAFELGKAFNVQYDDLDLGNTKVNDKFTLQEYIDYLWTTNSKDKFSTEFGQMKAITGDAWVRVMYKSAEEMDDPYSEYPNGKISIQVVPTNIVFPEYDPHNKEKLIQLTVMYPIEKKLLTPFLRKEKPTTILYRQVWTKDNFVEYEGEEIINQGANPYNVIPFVQIKNFPIAGRETGVSDLEDIIPLNVELNMKRSDISEIIDYHSAPVTLVFGAKVSNLEKGANKVWGNLPKDGRVQNLELNGDLTASSNYIRTLKEAMNDIGGIPMGALGGTQAISNTSGVALHFVNLPLIERTNEKRKCTTMGIKEITKLALHISEVEGLIELPLDNRYAIFNPTVSIPDTLPKDTLIQLQEIETEMRLGLESRKGAMKRLNKDNIDELLEEIKQDKEEEAEFQANNEEATSLNSGFTNGSTPLEMLRKETNGVNQPSNSQF